ncbi:hypothetical protein BDN72DRAFT_956172 [Pluteus cervinus]|uniref:Uncharacterized protein n=1 Tax=Pluteus cervinus TaxID=181527 RepID=A0ACD3B873_9AGAR|nr:hypothetical protein BDN72DRAFT_956172 [Pluteus cervinus]
MIRRLPFELERIIFLLAFKGDPDKNLQLKLVAKRVFHWLIPLTFGVNIIRVKRRLPEMGLLPFASYGRRVRHLLLVITENVPLSDLEAYVIYCPNVTNFALWIKGTFDPLVLMSFARFLAHFPHLTELSINTDLLPRRPSELLSQVLARITHLDVVTLFTSMESCRALRLFPALTHLSGLFRCRYCVSMILEKIPKLRVFVLWEASDSLGIVEGKSRYDDERVVHLACDSMAAWKLNAHGMMGRWKFAEDVITRRRREGG